MTTCYMTVGFTSHAEAEDFEALADELRQDVSAFEGLQTVALTTTSSVQAGTKGTPVDWGTGVVAFASSSVVATLVNVLGNWLTRDRRRTLELALSDKSLKLTGLSMEEQQALIAWFQSQTGFRLHQ